MTFNNDPESKLNVYGGLLVENTKGMPGTSLPNSMMRERLCAQLASQLAEDAVTVTETAYTKEHRLQVYVLTPAQLEKYVQRRAERLRPTIPNCGWADYDPSGSAP